MAKRKPNLKQCKASGCEEMFEPRNMQHQCHHYTCAIAYQKELTEKRAAKEKRQARKELNEKDKKWLKGRARYYCHKYIKLRDKDLPCISCGTFYTELNAMQAGHFKNDGNHANVRYHEDNIHGQCVRCNMHKGGEEKKYEEELRRRIGDERVDHILSIAFEVKRYTVDELKEIIDTYKSKIKGLE